ncbi:hypothetical protein HK097_010253 [Rhizophlyctis rosea]|uniref:Ribosome biogenesis protein SLX9 n=1 Tax=Rhizophlyctis rosea TaxID=64517 RepID=A0AAD5WZW4_9FUNG|nr:hypothetical protein HK097_010253 [Rhizophlyctis rosea]
MPKVKRERTKLHATLKPAPEPMVIDSLDTPTPMFTPAALGETFTVTRTIPKAETLTLPKTLPTQNTIGAGAGVAVSESEERPTSKRDKKQQRHERWLKKLGAYYAPKPAKPTAFDVDTLKSVLLTVNDPTESTLSSGSGKAQGNIGSGQKAVSQRARKKEAVNEIVRLQKILVHPSYKSNPLATIRQHLQNTLGSQQ